MKILKKSNKKILYYSAVFLFSASLIFIGYHFPQNNQKLEVEVEISENNPSWNLYENKEYGFSVEFPSNWKIYEDFETVSPTINIYLPNSKVEPPFDHFADIDNVSIFPKGLQTEAVIGQSQKTKIEFNFESDKSVDYLLSDGTVWATYLSFDSLKEPWKPWGFVWTRNTIKDLEYLCMRNSYEISLDECNPFDGDEFVRFGSVNPEIRLVQEEIIKTFKFIK
jgi:hypothetical protein